MKYNFKNNFFEGKKYALIFFCVVFLCGICFSRAQTAENNPNANSQASPGAASAEVPKEILYYSFPVIWDVEKNTLNLKDGAEVTLTDKNLVSDTGSGSQFYARVINFNNNSEMFPNGDSKLYLGKWEAGAGEKTKEVTVTIPAYKDGRVVIIYDAKTTDNLFHVYVTQFVQATVGKSQTEKNTKTAAVPAVASAPSVNGNNVFVLIVIAIGFLAIVGIIVYMLYRMKKKKAFENLPRNESQEIRLNNVIIDKKQK